MTTVHTRCKGCIARPPTTVPEEASTSSWRTQGSNEPSALSTSAQLWTATELFPGVCLVASVNSVKNQCIIELVKATKTRTGCQLRSGTSSPPSNSTSDLTPSPADVVIPPSLQAAFRTPRVIQVLANDEGEITTMELVTEHVGRGTGVAIASASGTGAAPCVLSPLANQPGQKARASQVTGESSSGGGGVKAGLGGTLTGLPGPSAPSADSVFAHLFIGTSNGTVFACNALRGTILVMAQFQYHHDFHAPVSAGVASTASTVASGGSDANTASAAASVGPQGSPVSPADGPAGGGLFGRQKKNEAVVRFCVQERGVRAQQWNPDLTIPSQGPKPSSFVQATATASSEVAGSSLGDRGCVTGVYAVHAKGKVVFLGRDILDTLISVSVNRLDGQRPYFALEWSPTSTLSSFPIAGPAANIATMVDCVYTLTPPTGFTDHEQRSQMSSTGTSSGHRELWEIEDAAFLFTSSVENQQLEARLNNSASEQVADGLIVCGQAPAYALYSLESQHSRFSASQAVRAVTSLVTGMARSLLFGGRGKTVDPPPRLPKKPQEHRVSLLAPDCRLSRVAVDPTQQYAAFVAEGLSKKGAERLYVTDVQTGEVVRVLKGNRSAQFMWWMTSVWQRPMLLLVVYLPQRHTLELHSMRLGMRVSACFVPEGSQLMRPSVGSYGDGAPLLITPSGEVLDIFLSFAEPKMESTGEADQEAKRRGLRRGSNDANDSGVTRSCRTPDDFFDVAMQLSVPQWVLCEDGTKEDDVRHANVETFKKYRRDLAALCEAVKRRYAPSYSEPRAVALSGRAGDFSVPLGLTGAQCLNYLQLRMTVVDTYIRLVSAATSTAPKRSTTSHETEKKGPGSAGQEGSLALDLAEGPASPIPEARQGSSLLSGEDPWSHCLGCDHASGKRYWEAATRLLGSCVGEDSSVLRQRKSDWTPSTVLKRLQSSPYDACEAFGAADTMASDRKSSSSAAAAQIAGSTLPSSKSPPLVQVMGLKDFAACFFCGANRIVFCREGVRSDENDSNRDIMGDLGELVFGPRGLGVFLRRLDPLSVLGLDLTDLATLTLSWVARECGQNLVGVLTHTSIGCLRLVLETLSTDAVTAALTRVSLPLYDSSTGAFAYSELRDATYGLLLCCAVQCSKEGLTNSTASESRFRGVTRQLLRLWTLSSAAVSAVENGNGKAGTAGQAATEAMRVALLPTELRRRRRPPTLVCVRLSDLLPNSDDGDSLVCYLLRKRLPLESVMPSGQSCSDGAAVLLGGGGAGATTAMSRFCFPSLQTALILSGVTPYVGAKSPKNCFVAEYPWLGQHTWNEDMFAQHVLNVLKSAWMATCPGNDTPNSSQSGPSPLLNKEHNSHVVQQCCVLLASLAILQQLMKPFSGASLSFLQTEVPPSSTFFARGTTPDASANTLAGGTTGTTSTDAKSTNDAPASVDWLSGSRSHRSFLTSLSALSNIALSQAKHLLHGADEVRVVLLIQSIAASLTDDDALVFPVIPRFFRTCLRELMQCVSQQPGAAIKLTQALTSFLQLCLFFVEASSLSISGTPLELRGLSSLRVPWQLLYDIPALFRAAPFTAGALSQSVPAMSRSGGSSVAPDPGVRVSPFDDKPASMSPRSEIARLQAALTLARSFLVKCCLVGGETRDPGKPLDAASCERAQHEDTKQILAKLCSALDVLATLPDLPVLLVFDFGVKSLCAKEMIERELTQVTERGLAARVAARNLQVLIGSCVKYCGTMKRYYMERKDRPQFDTMCALQRQMLAMLSDRCKEWIRRPSKEEIAKEQHAREKAASGRPLDSHLVVGDESWVSTAEAEGMDRAALQRLTLPSQNSSRAEFFELLFCLAQLASEGKAFLDVSTQEVVCELPAVTEGIRVLLQSSA